MSGLFERLCGVLDAAAGMVYPNWCQICDGAPAHAPEGFVCKKCSASAKLIHPPWCELCGRPYDGALTHAFTCAQCVEVRPVYSTARSAAYAEGPVLEAIHRYKYKRELYIEPFLARLLIEAVRGRLNPVDWDFIVPIPLHPKKEREREFNQAELLGKRLGQAISLPVNPNAVARVVQTPSQTKLRREERFKNVRKAFAARAGADLRGARVVLVDDVFTTGATANGCAQALLDGGAARVCVWTVARGV